MRLSQNFVKTRNNAPSDETALNAQLLIRAGYVHKEMAGVYDLLPLGLITHEKIKTIVREEMNALGGNELIMSSLQNKELWQKTDRWDDEKVDVWFKSKLKNNTEVGFGWSHEEPITNLMTTWISSYRDLPVYVYQFQNKLRNELRAKSGIMRCREFVMKDLYSYSKTDEDHEKFYQTVRQAYMNIFKRAGIGDDTFYTFASGGAFTEFSHEFQTICDAGEDIIYLDRQKKIGINKEVYRDDVVKKLGLKKTELEEVKVAEVGNIFSFGTTKSEQLGLYYINENGKRVPVVLGSYGLGTTRLMGVIVEKFADDKGLIWPENIAPAQVHLISLGQVQKETGKLYDELTKAGVEVLYDDRDESAGSKFADADLIGIPRRVVVSPKTLEKNSVEVKKRNSDKVELLGLQDLVKTLKK